MKAKQLRIGNLLKDKELGKTLQVKSIEYGSFKCKSFGMSPLPEWNKTEVEVIPLTEEWLIKFGFEKTDKETYFQNTLWVYNEIYIHVNDVDGEVRMNESAPIQYVHQFQNLYFALIGEELIKKS